MNNLTRILAQPSRKWRFSRLRQAVPHRWPALLGAAIVTAAVPVVTFAANGTQFPDGIQAGVSAFSGNSETTLSVSGPNVGIAVGRGVIGIDAQGDNAAVQATSDKGIGVDASSSGGGDSAAVKATDTFGTGVLAISSNGTAVMASSSNGTGVRATGNTTAHSFGSGVLAAGDEAVVARGTTIGVDATGSDTAVAGVADAGVGGLFGGKEAPIRMFPASTVGAPTSGLHHLGELYVDKNGDLFYCRANGTPGTWKQVVLK